MLVAGTWHCIETLPAMEQVTRWGKLARIAYWGGLALLIYQITINHLIQWRRDEMTMIRERMDTVERIDRLYQVGGHPSSSSTVYIRGRDVSMAEAMQLYKASSAKHETLLCYSPLHWLTGRASVTE